MLAHLWQVKEWRWDRLAEHFSREGLVLQLFGVLRPTIVAVSVLMLFVSGTALLPWAKTTAGLLALLTLVRILVHRQPMPRWTEKAIVLVCTALMLDLIILVALSVFCPLCFWIAIPLLTLLQWIVLPAAWMSWYPVDLSLKQSILRRAKAARALFEDLIVIGITGSVGKTTTKELLACILKPLGAVATPAYVNTELGVAKWLTKILSVDPFPPILVVEMGAYRTGEIAVLCDTAKPTMSVVTFVGNQHMALFGSPEKLFDAKSEIIKALPSTGQAFLNGDNVEARRMKDLAPCPVTIVSTGGSADIEAYDIEETAHGIHFRCGDQAFEAALHGTHNVTNVLLAIAVARKLGMNDAAIANALKSFTPPKQTFEVRSEQGVTILDDTHNSSPASVKAVIGWAKGQPFEKKTLLMAGLIELGEETIRAHRELGAAAQGIFDRVIFADKELAVFFREGFGKPVELLHKNTAGVPAGSLLCCAGRIPSSIIKRLLPNSGVQKSEQLKVKSE